MKQNQIVTFLCAEFGTADVADLNKLLRKKDAPKVKFRLSGKNLGHTGITGLIKMITAEGVKVIGGTRTILVRFADIEDINKAKDRSERQVYATPKNAKTPKTELEKVLEEDEEDDGDYSDLMPIAAPSPKKQRRRRSPVSVGKTGSKFIPKENK